MSFLVSVLWVLCYDELLLYLQVLLRTGNGTHTHANTCRKDSNFYRKQQPLIYNQMHIHLMFALLFQYLCENSCAHFGLFCNFKDRFPSDHKNHYITFTLLTTEMVSMFLCVCVRVCLVCMCVCAHSRVHEEIYVHKDILSEWNACECVK